MFMIDMVIEHHAVQVIDFMLEYDGCQAFQTDFDFVSVYVPSFYRHAGIPWNESRYVPVNRQASFT